VKVVSSFEESTRVLSPSPETTGGKSTTKLNRPNSTFVEKGFPSSEESSTEQPAVRPPKLDRSNSTFRLPSDDE
jgi:hypothetical protein